MEAERIVDPRAKYKRVVIKLSGEALARENGTGIDPENWNTFAKRSVT